MIASYPLKDIWPVIAPKIAEIRKNGEGRLEWRLYDVHSALIQKKAFLFNNDEDESFAIVKTKQRNGEKILFIWIAYGVNDKRDRNVGFLQEIARSVGASSIEMESTRRGYDRVPGWQRILTTYSMEVTHEMVS